MTRPPRSLGVLCAATLIGLSSFAAPSLANNNPHQPVPRSPASGSFGEFNQILPMSGSRASRAENAGQPPAVIYRLAGRAAAAPHVTAPAPARVTTAPPPASPAPAPAAKTPAPVPTANAPAPAAKTPAPAMP